MKKVLILMFVTVFALTGVAAAKGPGSRGHADGPGGDGQKGVRGTFWERDRVTQALSLTQEETAKLTELQNDHRNTVQVMSEDLREQRQAMKEIIQSEDFSPSDAKKLFKSTEKARARIHEKRFELQIQQRQLLGPERYVKLRKMERRAMERNRGNQ